MDHSKPMHTGDLLPDMLDETRPPWHVGRLMTAADDSATEGRAEMPWGFNPSLVPLWDKEIVAVDAALQKWGVTTAHIDEIAMLFPGQDAANIWVGSAVCDEDVVHFNASYDRVKTSPIQSDYTVRYDFLTICDRSYRIEAMAVQSGLSPLHAALLEALHWRSHPIPVHLSFKCPDLEVYDRTLTRLEANGFRLAQACESTYGTFSYWTHKDFDLYIKPRVNRRDAR